MKCIVDIVNKIYHKANSKCAKIWFKDNIQEIEMHSVMDGFKAEIDGYNTYVITDLAAWKITYDEDEDDFVLYHSPFSEPDKAIELEEAKTANYHLQKDAIRYHTPQGYIEYIKGHENDRKLENIDYRLMFHDSIRQKKYYNQAKRRYELRSINNTLKLISKLETKGEFKARRKVDG